MSDKNNVLMDAERLSKLGIIPKTRTQIVKERGIKSSKQELDTKGKNLT